jgi:hypothetical protein
MRRLLSPWWTVAFWARRAKSEDINEFPLASELGVAVGFDGCAQSIRRRDLRGQRRAHVSGLTLGGRGRDQLAKGRRSLVVSLSALGQGLDNYAGCGGTQLP